MAWNSGTFTGLYDWVQDQINGTKIRADRHKAQDDVFIAGINNCLTKDGQNTATGNLPMGTYKHTAVGNAAARDQYLTMAQAQDSGGIHYTTAGSSDAYTLTPSPAITAYAEGNRFSFEASFTNTGAATINISGLGVKTIKKDGSSDVAAGDIVSGVIYDVVYDGTNFQLLGIAVPATIAGDKTFSNDVTIDGEVVAKPGGVTVSGTSKTLALTDANTIQDCSNASTQTITIPANAAVAFAVGDWIHFEAQGAGTVTITGDTGVTVNGSSGGSVSISDQYKAAYIRKLATDTWIAVGALS